MGRMFNWELAKKRALGKMVYKWHGICRDTRLFFYFLLCPLATYVHELYGKKAPPPPHKHNTRFEVRFEAKVGWESGGRVTRMLAKCRRGRTG